MRRATLALTLCLLLAAAAPAQKKTVPLSIQGDTYLVVKAVPFKVVAPAGATDYTWSVPVGVESTDSDNVLTVTKAPVGQFVIKIKMTTIDFDAKKVTKDTGEVTITLGGVQPPTPGPTPGPGPTPSDVPIAGDGFRVLIVEDAANRAKLPASQEVILFDKSVRDYLATKCVKGDDNKTPERRICDKGIDYSKQKVWADALERANSKAKGTYPWIAISNGKEGFEGPLPKTVDETLALLKKYGG